MTLNVVRASISATVFPINYGNDVDEKGMVRGSSDASYQRHFGRFLIWASDKGDQKQEIYIATIYSVMLKTVSRCRAIDWMIRGFSAFRESISGGFKYLLDREVLRDLFDDEEAIISLILIEGHENSGIMARENFLSVMLGEVFAF